VGADNSSVLVSAVDEILGTDTVQPDLMNT
jgi:hypothetical protein